MVLPHGVAMTRRKKSGSDEINSVEQSMALIVKTTEPRETPAATPAASIPEYVASLGDGSARFVNVPVSTTNLPAMATIAGGQFTSLD